MIAHYRKSRDKSYGIVAGEVTEPLRGEAGDREDISDL